MTTMLNIKQFGTHDANTIEQMAACMMHGNVIGGALMADGHFGYSQPVGGVIVYQDQISVSGVGFDIACGNKAVETHLRYADIASDLPQLATEIFRGIEFGVGREDKKWTEHPIFDYEEFGTLELVAGRHEADRLKAKARKQLGTVGSGNHYVDVFVECEHDGSYDEDASVWIGVHFGSRGFGHTIASGFLNLAAGNKWDNRIKMEREEPTLLDTQSSLGQAYLDLMGLAGDYAYAGRNLVVSEVDRMLGSTKPPKQSIHNHHNFAWAEGGGRFAVRKGATPISEDQRGFIGGSMCDLSVIVKGTGVDDGSFGSTVHGAGRVMGRMAAKGKRDKATGAWKREPGVTEQQWKDSVDQYEIELRGAGVDESPFVYRKLAPVLEAHAASTVVETYLRPIIVCMAGPEVADPWRD